MDWDAIRFHDRIRGLASLADNGALAFFIGAFGRVYAEGRIDIVALGAVAVGFLLMYVGWNIRGLLQPEEL